MSIKKMEIEERGIKFVEVPIELINKDKQRRKPELANFFLKTGLFKLKSGYLY